MGPAIIFARPRALITGAAVLTLACGAVVAAAPGATADGDTIHPFADAGGFSVYVREDATLLNSEIEGALAVGGTLQGAVSGSRLPIMHKIAGTSAYDLPLVDGDATRLLVGSVSARSGIIDVAGRDADTGTAWGFAKVVSPDEPAWTFAARGDYTQYRLDVSGSEATGPVVEAKNQEWATGGRDSMLTAGDSVAGYVEGGEGFSATSRCLADLATGEREDVHRVGVTEDGGKAVLDLEAGRVNVLDYADLTIATGFASQVVYLDDVPAADTPVIVRVAPGTTAMHGMEFGTEGQYPRYVMWDLSAVTGAVSITDKSGGVGRIDGSIYAPYAALTASFGPLDGQVIARSLTTTMGSGELHAYMFASPLDCGAAPAPEPTPEPTAEPSVAPGQTLPTPQPTEPTLPESEVAAEGGAQGGAGTSDDAVDDAASAQSGGALAWTGAAVVPWLLAAGATMAAGAALLRAAASRRR